MLTGWDRPLQHFFLNIDRTCTKCGGEGGFGEEPNDADMCDACEGSGTEYLFNNLSDTTGMTDQLGGMRRDTIKHVLEQLLTWYPPTLMGDLATDHANNAGNMIETYETRGTARAK